MECPECGAEQATTAPFCAQCGYRFRTQETQLEGLPAITPSMLAHARKRGEAAGEGEGAREERGAPALTIAPDMPVAPGTGSFTRPRTFTMEELSPVDSSRSQELAVRAAHRTGTTAPEGLRPVHPVDRSGPLETRTMVEGLPAIQMAALRPDQRLLAPRLAESTEAETVRPEDVERVGAEDSAVDEPGVVPDSSMELPTAPLRRVSLDVSPDAEEDTEEEASSIAAAPPRPEAKTAPETPARPVKPVPVKKRSRPAAEASADDVTPAKPAPLARTVASPAVVVPTRAPQASAPAAPLAQPVFGAGQSGLIQAPAGYPPRKSNAVWVFAGVWGSITAVGVLFAYATIALHQHNAAHEEVSASAPSQRVALEAGEAIIGLNKETRSFILQACFKVADDPDEKCVEDRLMAGEYPEKKVTLPAFSIDSKEVTNGAYNACVAAGKCAEIRYKKCRVYTHIGYQIAMRVPKVMREDAYPAVCVTRPQAEAYCAFVGGQLPTHDQWERAARGLGGALFPWGETWAPRAANWGELDVTKMPIVGTVDGFGYSAPPGKYPKGATKDGLYDMAGNVSEWVRADAADPKKMGYARGGDWTSTPFALRTTSRKKILVDTGRTDTGFRCVYP